MLNAGQGDAVKAMVNLYQSSTGGSGVMPANTWNGRLVVASNRLPATQQRRGHHSRFLSVGGLVSALRPTMERHGGIWFGWSGATAEAPGEILEEVGPIQLMGVNLSQQDVELYYNGFSNQTLWPLLHGFPSKATIAEETYKAYRATNRMFAEVLLDVLNETDLVWVHDYHLIPLGYELRRLGWLGKLGWFLHTPFPSSETFAVLPWAPELLEALSYYQLIGLQTRRYVRNFHGSLGNELPAGTAIGDVFVLDGRSVTIRAYPVGIDPQLFARTRKSAADAAVRDVFDEMPADHIVVLGVDRLDYTKGIPYRLLAFERFLDEHPEMHGRVTLVQISVPTRESVREYEEERSRVEQLVGRINGRFSELHWSPIRYLYRSYSQEELAAFYRRAAVCMITPLADGMNLVAMEYVASQTAEDAGVLVLSKFCGAADTMPSALIVNPYHVEASADALYTALLMPSDERRARWNALMHGVTEFTAVNWSESFLSDLARL